MGKLTSDKRDVYYRSAKEAGFRARSAYKLLQLDDVYGLLKPGFRVCDLCAAPGGWSQVSLECIQRGENVCADGVSAGPEDVMAVDIQGMLDIPGVRVLKGEAGVCCCGSFCA